MQIISRSYFNKKNIISLPSAEFGLSMVNINPCPAEPFANSVDLDQLASEEANWSGSTLFVIMWICINNLDQTIWLANN